MRKKTSSILNTLCLLGFVIAGCQSSTSNVAELDLTYYQDSGNKQLVDITRKLDNYCKNIEGEGTGITLLRYGFDCPTAFRIILSDSLDRDHLKFDFPVYNYASMEVWYCLVESDETSDTIEYLLNKESYKLTGEDLAQLEKALYKSEIYSIRRDQKPPYHYPTSPLLYLDPSTLLVRLSVDGVISEIVREEGSSVPIDYLCEFMMDFWKRKYSEGNKQLGIIQPVAGGDATR